MPCSLVIYSNPASISTVNGEIHGTKGLGSVPVRRVSISLDFGANSTKVSFKNKTEKISRGTHQPRLLKWKSFRQWVRVTLLLPPQVNQTRTLIGGMS